MNAGRILPDLQAEARNAAAAAARFPAGRSGRAGRPRKVTAEQVKALWSQDKTVEEMMAILGCGRGTIEKRKREANLVGKSRPGRMAPGELKRARSARHLAAAAAFRPASMPAIDTPAILQGHTLHPSTVVPVEGLNNVLVDGENTAKIGGRIRKGRWTGFPVYTLTLEERATCPASCAHWRSCYGNGMHWSKRIVAGAALEERLGLELGVLASRHPGGFAIRLHVLGDFYSAAYVERWRGWLDALAPLHAFGFSARIDRDDPVAAALIRLVLERWERFAIRFSNAPVDECATVTIEHPLQRPPDAVICPQQIGKTESCSTCAFCWQSRRRVAFIRH